MLTTSVTTSILNCLFGKTNNVSFGNGTAYLGLSSTKPTISGGNVTEPSSTGTGYARTLLGQYQQSLTQKMGNPANNKISNVQEINFNKSQSAWEGTYQYACLFSAATGGSLLAWMKIKTPITVSEANVIPHIDVGDLEFEFTDADEVTNG